MNAPELFGIANCDTVKRARAWLAARGVDAPFHDFKKQPPTDGLLRPWCEAVGWEALLNRRGTTWRKLGAAEQSAVVDEASARALMLVQSSLIKRPVTRWPDGSITVGFDDAEWARRLC